MSGEAPSKHPLAVTAAVMVPAIMYALDTTIANVALPHMQGSLSATHDQIAWVLTSYIVASAIMTAPTAWLAARFGRRNYFTFAVIGFTVASGMCGAAQSLEQIVAFRILQGVFGASLIPISQSILLDTYPPEKHGSAMALWGVGVMIGPILGPTLGGYLTEFYGWRYVFYINLPIGIASVIGIVLSVEEHADNGRFPFDLTGFALLSLAVGSFQLMLDRGEGEDWFESLEIKLEAVVAATAFVMFIVHSLTAARPFVSLALFKDRNFLLGTTLMFLVGMLLYSGPATAPPFPHIPSMELFAFVSFAFTLVLLLLPVLLPSRSRGRGAAARSEREEEPVLEEADHEADHRAEGEEGLLVLLEAGAQQVLELLRVAAPPSARAAAARRPFRARVEAPVVERIDRDRHRLLAHLVAQAVDGRPTSGRRPQHPGRLVDHRADVAADDLLGALVAGTGEHRHDQRPQGEDLPGDQGAPDSGHLLLAAQEIPLDRPRPDAHRVERPEDQVERQPVGGVADDRACDGSVQPAG